MREKAFYIGLTLIIISFIACVISFYLLVYGIPTFLVGAILVLNEDFDSHINYNYYLVDEFGSRSEIPQILAYSDTLQRRPCVLVGGSGTIGQTIEANSTNQEKKGITYADFYVYNINTLDRNDYKSQLIFDSLTTVIVNQCRQQK